MSIAMLQVGLKNTSAIGQALALLPAFSRIRWERCPIAGV